MFMDFDMSDKNIYTLNRLSGNFKRLMKTDRAERFHSLNVFLITSATKGNDNLLFLKVKQYCNNMFFS